MFKLGLYQAVVRRSIRLEILSQIFAERKFGPLVKRFGPISHRPQTNSDKE
jgi:hypothetical protein